MKLAEFTQRARASRMEKKAKFEAAFERARRDLQLPEAPLSRPAHHTFIRSAPERPVLTLFPK